MTAPITILLIILVVLISAVVLLSVTGSKSGAGVVGGGLSKAEICARLDQDNRLKLLEFPGSIDDYDRFNKVSAEENKNILVSLFRKEYINYPVLVHGSGIIEFLYKLAADPEITFSHGKSYYKPEEVTIKYTMQRVKYYHEYIEPRYVSPLNSLTHVGKIKLFIADLQALMYLLPPDAVNAPSGGVNAPSGGVHSPPNSGNYKYTVIYIGSAPGHQTIILAEWFKNVKFLLYDGNRFDDRLKTMKNIEIFNTYFTDRETRKYYKAVHVLISDIRLSIADKKKTDTEYQIHRDMQMQQKWIMDMRPLCGSMVKFRTPYNIPEIEKKNIPTAAEYKYLGGKVYWQTFSNIQSTEGRLLSTAADIEAGPVHFDYDKYEAGCLQNNLRRVWSTYSPSIPKLKDNKHKAYGSGEFQSIDGDAGFLGAQKESANNGPFDENAEQIDMSAELIKYPGFDRCFDCQYLLYALAEYIGKFHPKEYGPKKVLAAFDRVVSYNKNLVCTCDSSYYKNQKLYVHGLFQNLTRFQKHVKFIEMWNSFMHNV